MDLDPGGPKNMRMQIPNIVSQSGLVLFFLEFLILSLFAYCSQGTKNSLIGIVSL
jgi:hypothetical protein